MAEVISTYIPPSFYEVSKRNEFTFGMCLLMWKIFPRETRKVLLCEFMLALHDFHGESMEVLSWCDKFFVVLKNLSRSMNCKKFHSKCEKGKFLCVLYLHIPYPCFMKRKSFVTTVLSFTSGWNMQRGFSCRA